MLMQNGGKITPEVPIKGSPHGSHLPKSSPTAFPSLTAFPIQQCRPVLQPGCSRKALKSVVLIPQQLQYFILGGAGLPERGAGAHRDRTAQTRVSLFPLKDGFLPLMEDRNARVESTNLCVAFWALVDLWEKSRGSPWLFLQHGTAAQLGFCPFPWWCPLSPLHQSAVSERTTAGVSPCSVPTASSFCQDISPLQHPHNATSLHSTGLPSRWVLWPLQKTALIIPKHERDACLSCPFSFPSMLASL